MCAKVFFSIVSKEYKNTSLLFKNTSQILYVWGFLFSSHSIIFTLEWRLHYITVEGLQLLTYTRHSWPLNSEGSLVFHTLCDTGHPFIMVIFEDLWHSDLLPGVQQWSCCYPFERRRSVAAGIRTPNLPQERRTHQPTAPPPR